MNVNQKQARRYHWCSSSLRSFIEEPHNAVVGDNKGQILNLTDKNAKTSRDSILSMSLENPEVDDPPKIAGRYTCTLL